MESYDKLNTGNEQTKSKETITPKENHTLTEDMEDRRIDVEIQKQNQIILETRKNIDQVRQKLGLLSDSEQAPSVVLSEGKLLKLENNKKIIEEKINKNKDITTSENLNRLACINEIFQNNPSLSSIGTKEQYLEYFEKLFPVKTGERLGEDFFQNDIKEYLNNTESSNDPQKVFLENFVTLATKLNYSKLEPYIRSEHKTINGLLREGKEINIENVLAYKKLEANKLNREWDASVVESYENLKKVIDQSYLFVGKNSPNNTLYRFIDNKNFFSSNNVGDIIKENAFLSTSVDKSYKDFYLNSSKEYTILTIKLPENSIINGVPFGNVEKEFLLPPGTLYKILDKKTSNIGGFIKTEVEVEILPGEHVNILGSSKDLEDFSNYIKNEMA